MAIPVSSFLLQSRVAVSTIDRSDEQSGPVSVVTALCSITAAPLFGKLLHVVAALA